MYVYETDECRPDYKNDYIGAITEGYAPRCIPAFWTKVICDRDPRFMSDFWKILFRVVGTKLNISTSYHLQTHGHYKRMNQTWEQAKRC
jgi:hypothetical protein